MKTIHLLRLLLVVIVMLGSFILANQVYLNEKAYNELSEQAKQDRELVLKRAESDEKIKKENFLLRQQEAYTSCMNTSYKSSNTEEKIKALLLKYQDFHFAFYFEDVKNQYSFSLRENDSYYGASVIKLLDALYLIHEAMEGRINLSDTILLSSHHIVDYSLKMEKYEVGDAISLEDLIDYAISVSDNTAHEMLYEYIGTQNLKDYASSIGVTLTISDTEHYGYMTAFDGYQILKEVYRILSLNNSYSVLLRRSMNNAYYNALNFQDVFFLHKYGLTEEFYNEIGIYDNENPYLLSLFTTYAYEDYPFIVNEFSKSVYDIYASNLKEKKEYCHLVSNVIF